MSDALKSHDICSVQDLQRCSLSHLTKVFGSSDKAQFVQKLAYGIDDSPVKPSGKPKSIGIEDAFKEINTVSKAEEKIKVLATRLLGLMINQEEKRQPANVKLTVRKIELSTKKWKRESRQMPMFSLPPIEGDNFVDSVLLRLMPHLMELFGKIVAPGEVFHLTLLGVAFVNFSEQNSSRCSISSFLQPVSKKVKLDEISARVNVNQSCQSQETLPPEVDAEVFSSLPPDVQMELRNEWKTRSSTPAAPPIKKKKSIADYFAKHK
jgi:DNA polymerase iota